MSNASAIYEKTNYYSRRDRGFRVGDYDFARNRVKRMQKEPHSENGYELASHFAEMISARRRGDGQSLYNLFNHHAARWKSETRHWSSVTKMLAHPSYLRIIGLSGISSGHEIERLLLRELQSEPDHWFAALSAITGEDPVQPEYDFDQAVEAWLDWGRRKGILQD